MGENDSLWRRKCVCTFILARSLTRILNHSSLWSHVRPLGTDQSACKKIMGKKDWKWKKPVDEAQIDMQIALNRSIVCTHTHTWKRTWKRFRIFPRNRLGKPGSNGSSTALLQCIAYKSGNHHPDHVCAAPPIVGKSTDRWGEGEIDKMGDQSAWKKEEQVCV